MLKKLALTATIATMFGASANAADQIRVVGSSTVYPFTTIAAESFGKATKNKTPIVESTGTGGGFKLFCAGLGDGFPDVANASRAIKDSEKELCAKNGVKEITEIKIGYDGIVLANSVGHKKYDLTKKQVFLALAKQVPVNGKLVANPNKNWSDIDKGFEGDKIEVYGPPPTSGTRDAFVELVMEEACKEFPEFKAAYKDESEMKKACAAIREDGIFIESGENDNLIVQKINANPKALGIFGYSFLEQNTSSIQGSSIGGVAPDFDSISNGKYSVSRPLFVYVKNANVKTTTGLKEFALELVSEKAIGEDGYLVAKGLIPLKEDELAAVRAKVEAIK